MLFLYLSKYLYYQELAVTAEYIRFEKATSGGRGDVDPINGADEPRRTKCFGFN